MPGFEGTSTTISLFYNDREFISAYNVTAILYLSFVPNVSHSITIERAVGGTLALVLSLESFSFRLV